MNKVFILTTIFSVGFYLTPVCGQNIEGKYTYSHPSGLFGGMTIEFSKNKFIQTIHGHFDTPSIEGAGYFIRDQKKLVLFYDKIKTGDSSVYEVVEETELKTDNEVIIFNLSVVDYENHSTAFRGAFVILGKDSRGIMQSFTDSLGNNQLMIWDPNLIDHVQITFLGYDSVIIPTKGFKNKSVTIKCTLRIPKAKYIEEGKVEFNIDEISNNHLKISNKETLLTLKKDTPGKKPKPKK